LPETPIKPLKNNGFPAGCICWRDAFNLLKAQKWLVGGTIMDPRFAHISDWIFDLDNCLYPASTGLFTLIDQRMGAYIQRLLACED
jgi:hypothetical protein